MEVITSYHAARGGTLLIEIVTGSVVFIDNPRVSGHTLIKWLIYILSNGIPVSVSIACGQTKVSTYKDSGKITPPCHVSFHSRDTIVVAIGLEIEPNHVGDIYVVAAARGILTGKDHATVVSLYVLKIVCAQEERVTPGDGTITGKSNTPEKGVIAC